MNKLIDHALLKQRRSNRYKKVDFLMKYTCSELEERLSIIDRKFVSALQINGIEEELAQNLVARNQADQVRFIDQLATTSSQAIDEGQFEVNFDILPDTIEQKDLILSPLSLQLANDTPGLLAQIFKFLVPDGLFMAAALGAGTLRELRECLLAAESEIYGGASARIIPFADIRDYGGLLQRAGFALPVIDSELLTVRYDDMFALMNDLRGMGMANPLLSRSKKPVHAKFFALANDIYLRRFCDEDGRIRASFNLIYLSGWKPHRNQQQPLKPGSAKIRLSDALNVREFKLKS